MVTGDIFKKHVKVNMEELSEHIFLYKTEYSMRKKIHGGSWLYPAGVNRIVKYDNGAQKGRLQKHKSFTTWPGLYIKKKKTCWVNYDFMLAHTTCKKCQTDTKKDVQTYHVLVTEQCEKVFWHENKHSGYFRLQHASTSLFPFLSLIPPKKKTQTCDTQHNLHIHISAHNRGKHRHTA